MSTGLEILSQAQTTQKTDETSKAIQALQAAVKEIQAWISTEMEDIENEAKDIGSNPAPWVFTDAYARSSGNAHHLGPQQMDGDSLSTEGDGEDDLCGHVRGGPDRSIRGQRAHLQAKFGVRPRLQRGGSSAQGLRSMGRHVRTISSAFRYL